MRITELHKLTFDARITAARISGPGELVLLFETGSVLRYRIESATGVHLFSTDSPFTYEDGGFDNKAPSTVLTLDDIVVVVNDLRTHGFIHFPERYHALHFSRTDNYADISCYPTLLFKDGNGVPHLAFAEAWNHLQIMDLSTRRILTAAKSLIEVGAEERHLEFYRQIEEHSKLAWPTRYDYFFGKLLLSPAGKRILSLGWGWGSADWYRAYDIEIFIREPRISSVDIGHWEHENRAACWLDEDTVVVACDPVQEEHEGYVKGAPNELHFYSIEGDQALLRRRVPVEDLDVVHAKMEYSRSLDRFVIFSDRIGLVAIDRDGRIAMHAPDIRVHDLRLDLDELLVIEGGTISVHKLSV